MVSLIAVVGHYSLSDVCVKETERCPSLTRFVNGDVTPWPALPLHRMNVETVPRTTPTRAYGLIIDQASLRRWTMASHEQILGED